MTMEDTQPQYLDGRILVAMPAMDDDRFERSVIYMCAHSDEGAMGLILNRQAENISFSDLVDQLGILDEGEDILLPDEVLNMLVHRGGPMDTGRGFVLHTNDYQIESSTLAINSGICLTATLEILKAIAHGQGPTNSLLALGYAGWGPGQLESEIQANGWLVCDPTDDLIFSEDLSGKYERALRAIGIEPAMLSSLGGHA